MSCIDANPSGFIFDDSIENEFAHEESNDRTSRGYLVTGFKAPVWDNLYTESPASLSVVFDGNDITTQAKDYLGATNSVVFLAWQFEKCPNTNAIHVHFVFKCRNATRFLPIRNLFVERYGLTRVNCKPIFSLKGAIAYCNKEETRVAGPYSFGDVPVQGKRSDLKDAVQTLIDNDWCVDKVAEQHPETYIKFFRGIHELANVRGNFPAAKKLNHVVLIFGEPGSGKSHFVYNSTRWDPTLIYDQVHKKYDNTYWPDYRNHPIVHIDEMSGSMFSFDYFKRLVQPGMDPSRCPIVMREGHKKFGSDTIIFTSNRLPNQWWDLTKVKASPWELFRRFTDIYIFVGEYGNESNPSRHCELLTVDERREFMRFCQDHKSDDAETLSSAIKYKYFTLRDRMPHSRSFIVGSNDHVDITTHTQNDRESKKRKFMNLQPIVDYQQIERDMQRAEAALAQAIPFL